MRILVALLAAIFLTPVVSADISSREGVVAFMHRYNTAYAANDHETYLSSYAGDISIIDVFGITDFNDYAETTRATIEAGGGVLEYEILSQTIRLGPDEKTAIVVMQLRVLTRDADGIRQPEQFAQETDVLFWRDGQWKIVSQHYSWRPEE